jgi:hypothetical protein
MVRLFLRNILLKKNTEHVRKGIFSLINKGNSEKKALPLRLRAARKAERSILSVKWHAVEQTPDFD